MALQIASLNSGSNGNCYYVGNEKEAVLIDAGISCRETEKRMKRIGLCIEKVKAIFISHEHSDHIRGVEALARKFDLPVYFTPGTLNNCRFLSPINSIRYFKGYEPVSVGALTVMPFPKFHDAMDPHSFVVSCSGIKIGVFTDIGAPCKHLSYHFRQCHAAFLEANYDEEMLEKGHYPFHLKRRIRGGRGHLSNRQALEFFKLHRPSFMSRLILSHLSKDNNCPKLVQQLFDEEAEGVSISVASRFEETSVFTIREECIATAMPALTLSPTTSTQMSLF